PSSHGHSALRWRRTDRVRCSSACHHRPWRGRGRAAQTRSTVARGVGASLTLLLRVATLVRTLFLGVLGRAERRGKDLSVDDYVLTAHLGTAQIHVLEIDDAVELTDAVEELGDLVVAAANLELHRNAHVELLRDLRRRRPTDEVDTRHVGDVLNGAQEGGVLARHGQHLVELALALLALGE